MIDAAMTDGAALTGALFYGLRAAGMWRDERQSNLLDGGDPIYGCYACADGREVAVGAVSEFDVALDTRRADWFVVRIADPERRNATPGPAGHPANALGVAYASPIWLRAR